MSSKDRLIEARRRQRDVAVDNAATAKTLLKRLRAERSRIDDAAREQLERVVAGEREINASQLERFDVARVFADKATRNGERDAANAEAEAIRSHQRLRQVEILKERRAERSAAELRKKERRDADELARLLRDRGALLLTVLCVSGIVVGSCQRDAYAPAPALSTQKTVSAAKGEVKGEAKGEGSEKSSKPAASQKDAKGSEPNAEPEHDKAETQEQRIRALSRLEEAEIKLLDKLRRRQVELGKQESELVARRAELDLLEKRLATKFANKLHATAIKGPDKADTEAKTSKRASAAENDLVHVLQKMPARSAAEMIAQMDPKIAASALKRALPAKGIARILAEVPAEQSALIAARLHNKAKGKQRGAEADKIAPQSPADDAAGAASNAKKKEGAK